MFVRQSEQVEARPMTMPGAQGVQMRLLVGREDGAPNFAMRLFDVRPGGCTPHHQHNYEHEILIIEGQGEVTGGDEVKPLKSGDVVFMPANELHQFRNTGNTPMRFVCLVPTQFDCSGESQDTPGS